MFVKKYLYYKSLYLFIMLIIERKTCIINFNLFYTQKVLIKDDGTSVYLARDLAAVYSRLATYGEFDWMLYVVGHAQKIHFCQVRFYIYFLSFFYEFFYI
jgi:arginyl-tRNA synthetase